MILEPSGLHLAVALQIILVVFVGDPAGLHDAFRCEVIFAASDDLPSGPHDAVCAKIKCPLLVSDLEPAGLHNTFLIIIPVTVLSDPSGLS